MGEALWCPTHSELRVQAGRVKASVATVLQICNFDNHYYSSGIFNDLHYLSRKQIGVRS